MACGLYRSPNVPKSLGRKKTKQKNHHISQSHPFHSRFFLLLFTPLSIQLNSNIKQTKERECFYLDCHVANYIKINSISSLSTCGSIYLDINLALEQHFQTWVICPTERTNKNFEWGQLENCIEITEIIYTIVDLCFKSRSSAATGLAGSYHGGLPPGFSKMCTS